MSELFRNIESAKSEPSLSDIKRSVVSTLSFGMLGEALKTVQESSRAQEVITLPEIQDAAKEGLMIALAGGEMNGALQVIKVFKISDETLASPEVKAAVERGFVEGAWSINGIIEIAKKFALSKEILTSPEVQEKAKRWISAMLTSGEQGSAEAALEAAQYFLLPPEMIEALKNEVAQRKNQ